MSAPSESEISMVLSSNGNGEFRRRKNYFECAKSQKIRNKNLIIMHAEHLSKFCKSIGLKIDEIILSPILNQTNEFKTKITILPNNSTKETKVFRCLMAKDLTNLSYRNYSLLKQTLNYVGRDWLPNINKITNMQLKLNDFFPLLSNNRGFYIEPINKIRFVCEKFLLKNENFTETKFKIKLSADGANISKKT